MSDSPARGRWIWLGALGWVLVTAVYITATGFRRMAAGVGFYSAPAQVVPYVVMMLVGAVLSPVLFMLFRRVRSGSPRTMLLVVRFSLIGIAYLAAWAAGLVLVGELGLLRGVPRGDPLEFWLEALVMMAFITLGLYAIMVMMFEAVRHLEIARQKALEAASLQAELAEAKTIELRARLNPGFVYQSFDVASHLMDVDVKAARSVLADLGELLRVSLGRNGEPEIALRDELELLRRYIDIQRHHVGGGITMETNLPEELASSRVPALILQPVVESLLSDQRPDDGPLTIRIAGFCRVDDLCLEVSAHSDAGGRLFSPGREGIERSRARLQLVHGGNADLQVMGRPGGPVACLRLPGTNGSVCHE